MSEENKLILERRKLQMSETTLLCPNDFKRNSSSKELVTKYSSETKEDLEKENAVFSIAGRVLTIRKMGNSTFANLHDDSGKLPTFPLKDETGKNSTAYLSNRFGDIVGVKGTIFKTKTGELTECK